MKHKILTIMLGLTLVLSLAMGLQDLMHVSACGAWSCEKVQASPFGTMFGIPLGLWAVFCLVVVITAHLKRKKRIVFYALSAMVGIEIYLTFVQLYFIQAICLPCFSFLGLLCFCFLLTLEKSILAKACLITSLFFFSSHFLFFFPDVQPRCTLAHIPADSRVEVFGSPNCSYCKQAIAQLKKIYSGSGADLVLRPVALSPADYRAAIDWVCSLFFAETTETAKRFGLKILWENEKRLQELEPGEKSLPVILVTTPQDTRVFMGWHGQFADAVYRLFEKDVFSGFEIGVNRTDNLIGHGCEEKTCVN